MLGCPHGTVDARKFARLWRPVGTDGNGLERITMDWIILTPQESLNWFLELHNLLDEPGGLLDDILGPMGANYINKLPISRTAGVTC